VYVNKPNLFRSQSEQTAPAPPPAAVTPPGAVTPPPAAPPAAPAGEAG